MVVLQTNGTTCFIDLATFKEGDAFCYGGGSAVTYFVRGVQKGNWFSYIPTQLRHTQTFDFGIQRASALINRNGDYVCEGWLSILLPQVSLGVIDTTIGAVPNTFLDASIRWTRNLMHNIVEKIQLAFNELIIQEQDSYWFDINAAYRLPESKVIGYRNMIGDIAAFTAPVGPGVALGASRYLTLPIPFSFWEDSGVAIPIAALPYNDVRIDYYFRQLRDLLVVYPGTSAVGGPGGPGTGTAGDISQVVIFNQAGKTPTFTDSQTYCHYAIVHNDERVKMGEAPRDFLIMQVQNVNSLPPFKDVTTTSSFDIRINFSVIATFWMAKNTALTGEQSNYTTEPNYQGRDVIADSTLNYDNVPRVSMRSDYYSFLLPYYRFVRIPTETGYHAWSYALHPFWLDPTGSTNFTALTDVSIDHTATQDAINAASLTAPVDQNGNPIVWPNSAGTNVVFPQKWSHVLRAMVWNIVRVASGSMSAPVL